AVVVRDGLFAAGDASTPSGAPAANTGANSAGVRPSCGVVSLNFAFDVELSPLAHHSLFISQHYRDSWRAVEDPDTGAAMGFNASAFNFYVHAPSRTDRSACPAGYDALTVLVPVPPLPSAGAESSGPLYDVPLIRSAVLARLQEMPGMPPHLSDHILHEHVRDPVVWASEFNLHRGAAFGLSHPLSQLAFFRPPIRDPRTARAYRVGSSTRPGNGVPLVMVSAALATKRILADVARELAYTPLHGGQSEQVKKRSDS
ncbi:hypothetical protein B484DRAFT_438556, partial [Ochromonadaceae sp. CCMP2298]